MPLGVSGSGGVAPPGLAASESALVPTASLADGAHSDGNQRVGPATPN